MTTATYPDLAPSPELLLREKTRHDIRKRLARGTLIRLNGTWPLTATEYESLYSEERHLLEVAATAAAMTGQTGVIAYQSAAVVHTLPLWRSSLPRVHLTVRADAGTRSSENVFRHRDALPEEDIEVVRGMRVTSLERTTADAIRVLPAEAALALMDAAMRRRAWNSDTRSYDMDAAEAFRGSVWALLNRMRGVRGIRQARVVAELADGRAESPGESVARLYLLLLGFAPSRLQVEVDGPGEVVFVVDGELAEIGVFWEFDGAGKYTDPAMTAGRTVEEIVELQRRREDWIVRATGHRFTRFGSEHLDTLETFAEKLRQDGVPLPFSRVLPIQTALRLRG